jgi:hypothetical protein
MCRSRKRLAILTSLKQTRGPLWLRKCRIRQELAQPGRSLPTDPKALLIENAIEVHRLHDEIVAEDKERLELYAKIDQKRDEYDADMGFVRSRETWLKEIQRLLKRCRQSVSKEDWGWIQQKLDAQWNEAVNARVQEFLENTIMPKLQEEQMEARRIMESRKGVMDRKSYKKILSCLHPDRVTDPGQKALYEEAFRLFTVLEKRLLDEKNSPTQFVDFPTTPAQWDELKRQANERKKNKRKTH